MKLTRQAESCGVLPSERGNSAGRTTGSPTPAPARPPAHPPGRPLLAGEAGGAAPPSQVRPPRPPSAARLPVGVGKERRPVHCAPQTPPHARGPAPREAGRAEVRGPRSPLPSGTRRHLTLAGRPRRRESGLYEAGSLWAAGRRGREGGRAEEGNSRCFFFCFVFFNVP